MRRARRAFVLAEARRYAGELLSTAVDTIEEDSRLSGEEEDLRRAEIKRIGERLIEQAIPDRSPR